MITISIFALSGLSIATLVMTKKIEEKRKKALFISNLISRGDTHARRLYHTAVHFYSEGKDRGVFLLKKQIPMHSKNSLNKVISYLNEKREYYTNNMRGSRLLKKSDGISEFFKNMSDLEKGNGVIHDVYDDSQN